MHKNYALAKQQLLEGAVQQAQGTLFDVREHIHCHTFTPTDYRQFLFYTAIYHHLQSNPQLAEHYFMGTSPEQHPEFGDVVQNYANNFIEIKRRWPVQIQYSRFQELRIDGRVSHSKPSLTRGTHLLQIIHKKERKPLYSQWFVVQEKNKQQIAAPRYPPKWPLYLTGTQALLAGYSFWMAHQKWNEAQNTQNSVVYQNINNERRYWLISSGGFSILSVVFFGVYYVW